MSSEGSTGLDGCARGEAEIGVVPVVVPFVTLGLRAFLAVVARRPLWRLPVFFVVAGAPDSGSGGLLSSAGFVFLGTDE